VKLRFQSLLLFSNAWKRSRATRGKARDAAIDVGLHMSTRLEIRVELLTLEDLNEYV